VNSLVYLVMVMNSMAKMTKTRNFSGVKALLFFIKRLEVSCKFHFFLEKFCLFRFFLFTLGDINYNYIALKWKRL